MFVRETSPGIFNEINQGSAIVVHVNGVPDVTYGPEILVAWSVEQLASIGVFPISPAAVKAGAKIISRGYERVDNVVTEVVTYDTTKSALKAYAAAVRWQKETGGITVMGVQVATDRESQALITGAYNAALRDSNFAVTWKCTDGSFVPLNSQAIISFAVLVSQWVELCFETEATVCSSIDSGSVTTLAQVDAAFTY